MKTLFQGIVVACLLGLTPLAQAGRYITLGLDKPTYVAGDQAIVISTFKSRPQDGEFEFYLAATLDDTQSFGFTPMTEDKSYSIVPGLTTGDHVFTVKVYLQNKDEAAKLNAAIAFYQSENARLTKLLQNATDPAVIASLQAQIAHDQALLAAAQNQLAADRRLLNGSNSITIKVQ